jgi:hypothetical protein
MAPPFEPEGDCAGICVDDGNSPNFAAATWIAKITTPLPLGS